jgi:predicted flap endonuclease-1-like 5' DNA nuclease
LTYDQIARLSDDQVRMVNDAIEVLPGRIRREDWVGQCRLFMQSAGHQSPHP